MVRKIGLTFKYLREQRGYSLSSFNELSISRAALSKFERGEAKMAFDKVVSAIQFMGVSLAEFEQFLKDYSLGEIDSIVDEIQVATYQQDKEILKELYNRTLVLKLPILPIVIKAQLDGLSEAESEQITQYFYGISYWGYKELCLFGLTMGHMIVSDVLYILELFLKQGHNLLEITKFKSYLALISCQAAALMTYRGYKGYGKYILEKIESLNLINTMYLRNLRNLTRGYWTYRFINQNKGNDEMLRALDILQAVGSLESANYYLAQYKKHVLIKKNSK